MRRKVTVYLTDEELSPMRRAGPANPLCQQRDKLLCEVPDGGTTACGSRSVALDARGLATHARRARSAPEAVIEACFNL